MSCEVLQVGVDDLSAWAVAVEAFRGVRHARHEEFLGDPATIAFVVREGSAVLGWAWGYRQLRADGESMLLLYEIEVVPSHRRKGVGRMLVEAFLRLGRDEGHRKMWLITGEDNDAAKALYEATGGSRSSKDDVGYWWQLDATSRPSDVTNGDA